MPRIPLRELEEGLRDPSGYRRKLLDSGIPQYGAGPSYFGALRDTIIYKLHKPNANLGQVRRYLNERLSRFRNQDRIDDTLFQFEWYVDEYFSQGHQYFETASRVKVSLTPGTSPDLICSGEVIRLDLVTDSQYAAWVFRSKNPDNWFNELRMPLTQFAVAQKLAVPPRYVAIGIYSFEEQVIDQRCFTDTEIARAVNRLNGLLAELGL